MVFHHELIALACARVQSAAFFGVRRPDAAFFGGGNVLQVKESGVEPPHSKGFTGQGEGQFDAAG